MTAYVITTGPGYPDQETIRVWSPAGPRLDFLPDATKSPDENDRAAVEALRVREGWPSGKLLEAEAVAGSRVWVLLPAEEKPSPEVIAYRRAADDLRARDGELEIDDEADAKVRIVGGFDGGAFVQSWEWIDRYLAAPYIAQETARLLLRGEFLGASIHPQGWAVVDAAGIRLLVLQGERQPYPEDPDVSAFRWSEAEAYEAPAVLGEAGDDAPNKADVLTLLAADDVSFGWWDNEAPAWADDRHQLVQVLRRVGLVDD